MTLRIKVDCATLTKNNFIIRVSLRCLQNMSGKEQLGGKSVQVADALKKLLVLNFNVIHAVRRLFPIFRIARYR